MPSGLCLILGGVRSGKSAFAEKLARELDERTLYVATGLPVDAAMAQRIQRHRDSRPASWTTLEEPVELAACLETALSARKPPGVVLVDSLDHWVSNLLLAHEAEPEDNVQTLALSALARFLEVCRNSPAAVFLVSSEVGLSMVPPNPLGRRFQDLLGLVNQRVAAAAGRVYFVAAGLPVELKGRADSSR